MNKDIMDYIVDKLTELLIKQDFEDKKKGKATYVKKTRAYKDLIKLIKDMEVELKWLLLIKVTDTFSLARAYI